MPTETINVDQIIEQIVDTLCEADVSFVCEIANKVLHAGHQPAGEDEAGYDLIEQTWQEV